MAKSRLNRESKFYYYYVISTHNTLGIYNIFLLTATSKFLLAYFRYLELPFLTYTSFNDSMIENFNDFF